jgi:hypothetical protein
MEELEYAYQSIQLFNHHLNMQKVAKKTKLVSRTVDSLVNKYIYIYISSGHML